MKILVLSNYGMGLYKFRNELLKELISSKYVVIVSLPNDDYVPKLISLGCKYIESKVDRRGKNPISDLRLLIAYIKIIKEIKPDIVLTYTIKPNIYGGIASQITRVPYIANITGLGSAVSKVSLLQKFTLMLYKKALKKAKCVFFQNKDNENFFVRQNIFTGRSKLIPGSGVNLDFFSTIEYPSDEKINFLFIARIMKEKGIDHYLDAAEYIRGKYPNTAFHILGFCEQDYEDILKAKHDEGIIIYHGLQHDVRKFHQISHCTIHPTYYPEGMSNVLLESAACGRPIITTNIAGCREIVDDGINGYVVMQKNSQDLIEKIVSFLKLDNGNRKQMGLAGRSKVEKEFDRQEVVKSYLNLIQ